MTHRTRALASLLLLALASPIAGGAQAGIRRDDAPPPRIERITVESAALKESRTLWVHLPPHYGAHRRALPVTFVLDGHDARLRDLAAAVARFDTRLDALDPDMPEAIVVGVESRGLGRDYAAHAAAMRAFLADEVLPLLRARYRVAELHTLVGHSQAGAFALQTACAMPGRFLNVVAISPALEDARAVTALTSCFARLAEHGAPHPGVFVTYGTRAGDVTEAGFRPFIAQLERGIRAIPPTRRHAQFVEQPGVSHARTTLRGIPEGLAFVLARNDLAGERAAAALLDGSADPLTTLDSIRTRYRERGWLGAMPVRWYELAAIRLQAAGRGAEAERVVARARAEYPDVAALRTLLRDLGAPPPTDHRFISGRY